MDALKTNIKHLLKANKELDIIILKHLTIKQCDEIWLNYALIKFINKYPKYPILWED